MIDHFDSGVPFDPELVPAAAVYCSDGRFGEAFDRFLTDGLGLPAYNRIAIPGGAGCLAGHFDAWRDQEAALAQLKLLIEVHRVQTVVLMVHEGCAFYTERLRLSTLGLEDRQREDLGKAAAAVAGLARHLEVLTYLARVVDGVIRFEAVPAS